MSKSSEGRTKVLDVPPNGLLDPNMKIEESPKGFEVYLLTSPLGTGAV
jgi:hypothetical protein